MTTNRLIGAIASFLSIFALMAIVALAIGTDRLVDLIGGVFAVGAIGVALAVVGVALYTRMSASRATREELLYSHAEAMAKQGIMVNDRRALCYAPIAQLDMPADVPVSLQGITQDQLAEFKIHAVNLLALSKQEMGENSGQVIPFYRARENDYFRDVAIWTNAVRFLIANNMAMERYKGNKKIGTFLNAGTVGQAFANLNRP
jgi:hypothetical protein